MYINRKLTIDAILKMKTIFVLKYPQRIRMSLGGEHCVLYKFIRGSELHMLGKTDYIDNVRVEELPGGTCRVYLGMDVYHRLFAILRYQTEKLSGERKEVAVTMFQRYPYCDTFCFGSKSNYCPSTMIGFGCVSDNYLNRVRALVKNEVIKLEDGVTIWME